MRILHVIPYISPLFGGPPQVIKDMVRALMAEGHDVIVLSTTVALNKENGSEISMHSFDTKIYRLFPASFLRNWFYSKPLIDELKKISGIIDLIHLHVPFTAPFYFASKWARKNNIPYVITTHGLLDSWSMNQKRIKKWIYYLLIERSTLKNALRIHATSEFEKKEIQRLNLGVSICTIPLPISFDKKSTEQNNSDNDVCIYINNVPHILFVGRLHPVKGIPYLLKALEILKQKGINVILDLAGSGDNLYVNFLLKKIQEYGLNDFVVFHHYVNALQKQILYKRASAFILPSLHENFGLAAAEAMLAGVPVVVTDQVGLAVDVEKYKAGIVVPACNSELLSIAISNILDAGQVAMAEAAIDLVKNEYDFNRFSDRLNSFYSA
jgi:glycosyltransferase involved in cell wall biosynthesis